MNKLKKFATVAIAAAMLMAFAGCSSSVTEYGSPQPAPPVDNQQSTAAPTTEESSTPAENSVPAEESSEPSEAESSAEETEESSADEESSEEESSEAASAEVNVKDYVYFDNSSTKWDKVCAYWWNDQFSEITNKVTGELYPANGEDGTQDLKNAWPGVELEQVEGTDIYRCAVPVGATKIVFNDGVPNEEVKNGAEAYQTDDMDFSENDNAGQLYSIDVSVEPVAGRGKEKTKFKYGAGTWSDYNG